MVEDPFTDFPKTLKPEDHHCGDYNWVNPIEAANWRERHESEIQSWRKTITYLMEKGIGGLSELEVVLEKAENYDKVAVVAGDSINDLEKAYFIARHEIKDLEQFMQDAKENRWLKQRLEAVKKRWIDHRGCSGDCEDCDTVDWCLFSERAVAEGSK